MVSWDELVALARRRRSGGGSDARAASDNAGGGRRGTSGGTDGLRSSAPPHPTNPRRSPRRRRSVNSDSRAATDAAEDGPARGGDHRSFAPPRLPTARRSSWPAARRIDAASDDDARAADRALEEDGIVESSRDGGGRGDGGASPAPSPAPTAQRRRSPRSRRRWSAPSFEGVLRLWNAVAEGIAEEGEPGDKTITWGEILKALQHARRYFAVSADARSFVDNNVVKIMCLCEGRGCNPMHQQPRKRRSPERDCAEKSLRVCLQILSDNRGAIENHGAKHLAAYLSERARTPRFPDLKVVHHLLRAVEHIPPASSDDGAASLRRATQQLAKAIMEHVSWLWRDDDALAGAVREGNVGHVLGRLHSMHCRPTRGHRLCPEYFVFWRKLALRAIRSRGLPTRAFGWDQLNLLVAVCEATCPPPRAYVVSGAGTGFVNGRYDVDPAPGGAAEGLSCDPDAEVRYRRRGGRLTLRHGDAASSRYRGRRWVLGTGDVDYYRHKFIGSGGRLPPLAGWVGCHGAEDPPPTLRPVGVLAPRGEERDTLAHRLARWAVEERLVEAALGVPGPVEVVEGSSRLFRFLARMCRRCDWPSDDDRSAVHADASADRSCLRASHLLLAWELCSKTTDVRALTSLYLTAQSILPSLPGHLRELAFPIIRTAIVRRIEMNDPTLLELHIGGGFDPDPADREVCAYEPVNDADLVMLGYAMGKNARLRLQFDGAFSSEKRSVVLASALLSKIIGIWDVMQHRFL